MNLRDFISDQRVLKSRSTKVVAWHSKYGQVRGPYFRWFTISRILGVFKVLTVPESYSKYVAHVNDDANYCAAAMNNYPKALDAINKLQEQRNSLLQSLHTAKVFTGDYDVQVSDMDKEIYQVFRGENN